MHNGETHIYISLRLGIIRLHRRLLHGVTTERQAWEAFIATIQLAYRLGLNLSYDKCIPPQKL